MKQPMEQANVILRENLKEIRTVAEWAQWMGYDSPKYFARAFKKVFGTAPKYKMKQVRLDEFQSFIKNNPDISCYELGMELGIGDEHDLNKYIKNHTDKSPKEWKKWVVKIESKTTCFIFFV